MKPLEPFLLGIALALCLPPSPVGFLAPLPLAWMLTRGGLGYGFWLGVGFWAAHMLWFPISFAQHFGPFGAVPYVPLVLLKALSWGLLFGLTKNRPLARVGAWVGLEYLTSLGELAFPWGFLGYALVEAPGRVLASLGGVYLLSLVVLLVAWALSKRQYWVMALWILLWITPLPAAPANQTALLVQGNINPRAKMQGFSAEQIYTDLTRRGLQAHPGAKVMVFPETAISHFEPDLIALLGQRELISGQETGGPNRVVRVVGGAITQQYDKNRLVPFSENFPWRTQLRPLYNWVFDRLGLPEDLAARSQGSGYTVLDKYGAYICYESVFPSVARALVQSGAEVLELGSNDSWHGPSFGAKQHFQMGRLRAVETGRWLLRAGNSGITAIIDPYGRVTAQIPQEQPGYLAGQFAFLKTQTLYVRWGDWAVALAVLLMVFGYWRRTL